MDKNDSKSKTKAKLMNDLESLKGVLDDDDVPMLVNDDDDIPVLKDDDDVPVLSAEDDVPMLTNAEDDSNKMSLEAALKQLESMELAPKAKPRTTAAAARPMREEHQVELPLRGAPPAEAKPIPDLMEKIRANAAPPMARSDEKTRVRENPFLTQDQKERLDHSKKLTEENRAANRDSITAEKMPEKDDSSHKAIEFVASEKPVAAKPAAVPEPEDDAAADILKLLDDEPIRMDDDELDIDAELADIDKQLADINTVPAAAPAKPASAPVRPAQPAPAAIPVVAKPAVNKQTAAEIDRIVDQVIDEYMVVMEAALRKKLKEKLPDLLK